MTDESIVKVNRLGKMSRKRQGWAAMYEAMLRLQGGGCAICGAMPGGHRHIMDGKAISGETRGVICKGCCLHVKQVDYLLMDIERFNRILNYIKADGEPLRSQAQREVPHFDLTIPRPSIRLRQENVIRRLKEIWRGPQAGQDSVKQLAEEFGLHVRTIRRYIGLDD